MQIKELKPKETLKYKLQQAKRDSETLSASKKRTEEKCLKLQEENANQARLIERFLERESDFKKEIHAREIQIKHEQQEKRSLKNYIEGLETKIAAMEELRNTK